MTTTRTSALALAAAVGLALTACGGTRQPEQRIRRDERRERPLGRLRQRQVFCIGLVTDMGKVDDKSFNQSAWEGVEAAAKELGAQTKYVETTDTKDYANNIKQFTDKKYDVVVTVGFLMEKPTATATTGAPDTHFIGVDQFQA